MGRPPEKRSWASGLPIGETRLANSPDTRKRPLGHDHERSGQRIHSSAEQSCFNDVRRRWLHCERLGNLWDHSDGRMGQRQKKDNILIQLFIGAVAAVWAYKRWPKETESVLRGSCRVISFVADKTCAQIDAASSNSPATKQISGSYDDRGRSVKGLLTRGTEVTPSFTVKSER